MITDEDKVWLRDSDDQFVLQHVDGRYYIDNEHPDFKDCGLQYDEEEDVYFFTKKFHDFDLFITQLGFEPYEPFVG